MDSYDMGGGSTIYGTPEKAAEQLVAIAGGPFSAIEAIVTGAIARPDPDVQMALVMLAVLELSASR